MRVRLVSVDDGWVVEEDAPRPNTSSRSQGMGFTGDPAVDARRRAMAESLQQVLGLSLRMCMVGLQRSGDDPESAALWLLLEEGQAFAQVGGGGAFHLGRTVRRRTQRCTSRWMERFLTKAPTPVCALCQLWPNVSRSSRRK